MENKNIKTEMRCKTMVIFSLQLARLLLSNGCRLVDLANNTQYPSKIVFYFEKTELCETIIKKYDAKK